MVDFARLNRKRHGELTPEEMAHEDKYHKLVEENLLYKTTTYLDDQYDNILRDGDIEEEFVDVTLFRHVNFKTLEVAEKVCLKFGNYYDYHFDKRFAELVLVNMHDQPDRKFSLQDDLEIYVKNYEMLRIVKECIDRVEELNLLEVCGFVEEPKTESMNLFSESKEEALRLLCPCCHREMVRVYYDKMDSFNKCWQCYYEEELTPEMVLEHVKQGEHYSGKHQELYVDKQAGMLTYKSKISKKVSRVTEEQALKLIIIR